MMSELVLNSEGDGRNRSQKEETERCGRVVITSASYSGDQGFKSLPGDRLRWQRFSVAFLSPTSNVVFELLVRMLRIHEVTCSNFSQEIGNPYCGFSWFYSAPPGQFRDNTLN
jgi:hypothetical protein